MIPAFATVAFVVALVQTTATSGRYCGPSADTASIQARFLKEHAGGPHPVKLSNIMAIAAYFPGGAGQVVYVGAGMGVEYFAQTSGGWRSIGYSPPSFFRKDALAFFNRMLDLRANGGKQCANPKFVNVGSG
ncbi:MAG TPA: hypothetical protein VIJ12_08610 [Candidatus Baltobacteraceae bacterium]